ncbi:hypothetical protein LOAG_13037 [Loa loa]|uniref:Uncharacterized protein n=1 Tax=Loa loa TaxID=7209 RepID=A0A1S0TL84_LOALO|nr:hypothetical protein LOAG_13037 [Loa loa]EFO15474.1 hypothetical protein LOAG_13037 [Loa loa]
MQHFALNISWKLLFDQLVKHIEFVWREAAEADVGIKLFHSSSKTNYEVVFITNIHFINELQKEVFIEWWGRHLFIAVVLNVKVDLLLLMLTVMASQLSHQLKRMKFCHLLRCIAAVMRSKPPSL